MIAVIFWICICGVSQYFIVILLYSICCIVVLCSVAGFLQRFYFLSCFCSRAQTQSDLSVWSMCRGIRGAQLQYWCRTPYNPLPLHPSTHLSVSFDTELTPTWAAFTPIMHQPATWVLPLALMLTLQHHQLSSSPFPSTVKQTHTPPHYRQ